MRRRRMPEKSWQRREAVMPALAYNALVSAANLGIVVLYGYKRIGETSATFFGKGAAADNTPTGYASSPRRGFTC
mgnify:CR=1 FL=1